MADDKIIKIESELAHHERQIQDLSAMLTAQWDEIGRLKRLLDSALSKLEDVGNDPAAVTKPPHY